jgi:hypothetical protein
MPLILTPGLAARVVEALQVLGYRYEEEQVGDYRVLHRLAPYRHRHGSYHPVARTEFSVESNYSPSTADAAVDGVPTTRWGSGHRQLPGMRFVLRFKKPREVVGISYGIGSWRTDFARGLEVRCEIAPGTPVVLLTQAEASRAMWFRGTEHFELFFPPQWCDAIVLEQRGEDPIFDWSIAELSVYETDDRLDTSSPSCPSTATSVG